MGTISCNLAYTVAIKKQLSQTHNFAYENMSMNTALYKGSLQGLDNY